METKWLKGKAVLGCGVVMIERMQVCKLPARLRFLMQRRILLGRARSFLERFVVEK